MPSLGLAARNPYKRTPFASMTNEGAADSYARTGKMPKTTYGGKFGLAIPEPGAAPPAAPTPRLGLAPTTPGQFALRMHNENPNGRFFQGTLPAIGQTPSGGARPMFFSGPVADHLGSVATVPSGRLASSLRPDINNPASNLGLTELSPGNGAPYDRMQAAKSRFLAAHPNDLPQEQRYHGLGLATPGERGANRFAKAYDKRESRRLNNGIVNFEQRLGLADPAAFQQRQVGEAGVAATAAQNNATNAYRQAALAQQGQLGLAQVNGLNERAKLNAQAHVLGAGGDPSALGLAGATPPKKDFTDDDYRSMPSEDAVAHMTKQGMTPSEINTRMRAITGVDHNYYQNPAGPGLFGATTPVMPPPKIVNTPAGPKIIPSKRPKNSAQVASDNYGVGSGFAF